jgi:DNA-binding transcriptional MerR regulator
MTSPSETLPHPVRFRSGTAARLAGLPVTTLRVWERRYGVVPAAKTESGQRIYSPHDVSRLRLLRQLTQSGHAIGTIATLELDDLQGLARGLPTSSNSAPEAELAAVVVGRSAAHALEAVAGCVLRAIHDDLDQAESAPAVPGRVDLLLVRIASLQPATVERLLSLGAALRAGSIFVIYNFGTEASARALSDAGATVRREPVAGRELTRWVRTAREVPTSAENGWHVAPRRFSDEALAQLAAMPSPVSCECLRHMAELVSQLAGFERYSQDCMSTGPADAALHRQLCRTAGVARTMFEQALQGVASDEGLDSLLR